MTSPYNRLVHTPAEKKAKQQADTFAAFRQALEKPGDTTLDEFDLIKMEFQEGGRMAEEEKEEGGTEEKQNLHTG